MDGGHWPALVENDLMIAARSVCAGGIICLDDFMHSGFPGVMEGTFNYFRKQAGVRISPFAVGKNKLFLTSYAHTDVYRSSLQEKLPGHRIVELLGHGCLASTRIRHG